MVNLDSRFWRRYFRVYDYLKLVIPYQEMMDLAIQRLELEQGDRVLDAGSGTGNLSQKMKELGVTVVSIDKEKEALKIHKQKDESAEVKEHDLTNGLPFEDASFDKVVSINTLYLLHRKIRQKVLNEFYRVLKHGGRVVITNPRFGAKPLKIYLSHISKAVKSQGLIRTIFQVFKLVVATLMLLYYNSQIKKHSKQEAYGFLKPDEHQTLLQGAGFIGVSVAEPTYSDQAILNYAQKGANGESSKQKILIRNPKNQEEYKRACVLIEKIYQGHGYIEHFCNNPSILFVALTNGDILGSVGLIVEGQNGRFPTEEIFNFSFQDNISRSGELKIAEISRLAAMDSQTYGLTRGLFLALYKYVLQFNIDYCIASVKPYLYEVIKEKLKIPIHRIDKEVVDSKVPKIYEGYFLSSPKPLPIYIDVKEVKEAFEKLENEIKGTVDIGNGGNEKFEHTTNYHELE